MTLKLTASLMTYVHYFKNSHFMMTIIYIHILKIERQTYMRWQGVWTCDCRRAFGLGPMGPNGITEPQIILKFQRG